MRRSEIARWLRENWSLILSVAVTAAITVVTFCFSSQNAEQSSALSGGIARSLLDAFSFPYSLEMLHLLNHILRKTAHFTLYFILGCSLTGITIRQKRCPALLLTVLLGAVFAALDEFHQSFVPGRGPGARDVLLDTAGVTAGSAVTLLLIFLYHRRWKKRPAGRAARQDDP